MRSAEQYVKGQEGSNASAATMKRLIGMAFYFFGGGCW